MRKIYLVIIFQQSKAIVEALLLLVLLKKAVQDARHEHLGPNLAKIGLAGWGE